MFLTFILGILITSFYYELTKEETYSIKPINDRDYAFTVLSELKSAKQSIHVSMFSLSYYLKYADSKVNLLMKALVDKHKEGVDVKIILDEFPKDHEPGLIYLKENGVPVKYDGKEQTTHTKLIIIDSKKIIIGSTNWRYYSIEENHEANVLIESPDIAEQYEEYFENIWNTK